jgi:membrane-associated phospholipid phosphatase
LGTNSKGHALWNFNYSVNPGSTTGTSADIVITNLANNQTATIIDNSTTRSVLGDATNGNGYQNRENLYSSFLKTPLLFDPNANDTYKTVLAVFNAAGTSVRRWICPNRSGVPARTFDLGDDNLGLCCDRVYGLPSAQQDCDASRSLISAAPDQAPKRPPSGGLFCSPVLEVTGGTGIKVNNGLWLLLGSEEQTIQTGTWAPKPRPPWRRALTRHREFDTLRKTWLSKFIIQFLDLYSVKLLPLLAALWLLWFGSNAAKYRPAIVQALIGMFLAVVVTRAMQDFLPEPVRPLHSGDSHFLPPLGVKIDAWEHWSSFPSDTAAVFFAISTAVWLASRPLGAAYYAWSVFLVCIPRIFAGKHYATDVIAGAAIGIFVVPIIARPIATKLMPLVRAAEAKKKAIFYVAFFLLSYQFSTMSDDVRQVGNALKKKVRSREPEGTDYRDGIDESRHASRWSIVK